eukprot:gene6527-biopygen13721
MCLDKVENVLGLQQEERSSSSHVLSGGDSLEVDEVHLHAEESSHDVEHRVSNVESVAVSTTEEHDQGVQGFLDKPSADDYLLGKAEHHGRASDKIRSLSETL